MVKLSLLLGTLNIVAESMPPEFGLPSWVDNVTALGALIFVVVWFTRSMDRRDLALRKAVDAFAAFEEEERTTHDKIVSELRQITELQRDIALLLRDRQ